MAAEGNTGPPSHSEVEQFFTVLPWCLMGQQTNMCLHLQPYHSIHAGSF